MIDLEPAARRMADLVTGVPDAALTASTPCPAYTVGDLLDHVGGLSLAFTWAATKDLRAGGGDGPSGDASRLGPDWRTRIVQDVGALARAWRDPAAWSGMTKAGGIELPGDVAGVVALNELVVHGWDVAVASGQPYTVDEPTVQACIAFVEQFSGPGSEEARAGGFGPVVEVAADAPALHRLLGLAGRHPDWTPG